MAHPKLLIIIAQSGRMLAQSAAREGYIVRVADCFGDDDMLNVAERYHQLTPLDKLSDAQWLHAIISLSDKQPCLLICGTGIERFYSQLSQLPSHIQYAGTSAKYIEQICIPQNWITLLDTLALPHPPTHFHNNHLKGEWLAKSPAAWGGSHITKTECVREQTDKYYQQQIEGVSASVLFLATGSDFRILLINQQYNRNNEQHDFCLQAIHNGFELNRLQQKSIQEALQKLTQQLELVGLMSLDFIVTASGDILLLEINPRPTASCQLLPIDSPVITWQLMCSLGVMPNISNELPNEKQLLWFCFAPKTITIPANFDWPDYCYDIPTSGSVIEKNGIICSLLLAQNTTDKKAFDGHQCANKLIENLSISA